MTIEVMMGLCAERTPSYNSYLIPYFLICNPKYESQLLLCRYSEVLFTHILIEEDVTVNVSLTHLNKWLTFHVTLNNCFLSFRGVSCCVRGRLALKFVPQWWKLRVFFLNTADSFETSSGSHRWQKSSWVMKVRKCTKISIRIELFSQ